MEWFSASPFKTLQRDTEFWKRFFITLEQRLAAIHQLGVAHCDLRSLNNVLVNDRGEVFIVDFVNCNRHGLLKAFATLTRTANLKESL